MSTLLKQHHRGGETLEWTTSVVDGTLLGYATAIEIAMQSDLPLLLIVDCEAVATDPRRWFCRNIRDSQRCNVLWELRDDVHEERRWEIPYKRLRHVEQALSVLEKYIPTLDPLEFDQSELWEPHECALFGDNAWKFWSEMLCQCTACEECMARSLRITNGDFGLPEMK